LLLELVNQILLELDRTTTTDLTAEQIHQISLDEVVRIHKEMPVYQMEA